jgi:hypothetical protein
MTRRSLIGLPSVVVAALLIWTVAPGAQSPAGESLGQARIPRAVVANGQPLAAGTYTLRLSSDPVTAVVGQTPAESRWVEFVQGGQVRGRELATVLSAAELAAVTEGRRPAAGAVRVDLLKGNDYVRVWVNRAGTHYLVHLAIAP